jgi:flagellar protein FliS
MSQAALARYQTAKIQVSDPGELLMALFDGLFRFLHVARHSMRSGKRAQAGEAISRAHAILGELYVGLDHERAPDLCANLAALYDFSMARVTQANMKNDATLLDDVVRVLTPVREGFGEAVKQVAREGGLSKVQK